MPIGTSDGKYFDSDTDYWHEHLFGPQQQEQPEGESKLFLVRHGDTDLNEKGSEQSKDQPIRGWSPIGLNDDGIQQAHKAADSLKDKEVTRVVSSDLPRAKQTANIIGKKLDVPVQFDPNLRTWDMGDYDGSTDPAHRESVNKFATEDQNTAPPGSSESFNQFKDRIINTVTGYAANNEGHNTVIVTHHSPERVFGAWEHAGYPSDNGIHMATYEEDGAKPGGHIGVEIPEHVFADRFQGEPNRLPSDVPGYDPNEMPLNWWRLEKPLKREWPDEAMRRPFGLEQPREFNKSETFIAPWDVPGGETQEEFNKNNAKALYQPIMESPDEKLMGSIGPRSGRNEGGGSLNSRGEPLTYPTKARFGNQNSVGNQGAKIDLEPSRGDIEKLIKEGKSDREIADTMNLNERLVSSRRKEWGFENNYQKKLWPDGRVDQLKQMDKDGLTPREISAKLGVSRNSVIGKLNRLKSKE